MHVGNLAARALFADMEGQPVKAFKVLIRQTSITPSVTAYKL
jgi:hypothetical protein